MTCLVVLYTFNLGLRHTSLFPSLQRLHSSYNIRSFVPALSAKSDKYIEISVVCTCKLVLLAVQPILNLYDNSVLLSFL